MNAITSFVKSEFIQSAAYLLVDFTAERGMDIDLSISRYDTSPATVRDYE